MQFDVATYDELIRVAGHSGESAEELASKCIRYGLRVVEIHHRVERFASFIKEERKQLANDAGNLATGAQLIALEAEDGGYD